MAELAVAGEQSRGIAVVRFVTMATVEYHRRKAYRRLGVASRTELGDALA